LIIASFAANIPASVSVGLRLVSANAISRCENMRNISGSDFRSLTLDGKSSGMNWMSTPIPLIPIETLSSFD